MTAGAPGTVVMVTQDRRIDRRILLEAATLREAGWQVTILAMPADEAGGRPDEAGVVRIRPAGQGAGGPARENAVLGIYRFVRRRVAMDGALMRLLKRLAWRFVVREDTFYLRLFEEAVRAHPASVYVAHDLPMLPVGAFAKQLHGCKLVYDSHELYPEQLFSPREQQAWRRLESRHIGQCDAVITINPSIARELAARHSLHHVHVVYNAERLQPLPVPRRRFHQAFGLGGSAKVLLFQGGLSAGRNLETLVRAMGRVKADGVHLVLLGDGALAPVLRRLGDAAAPGRVHLHPAVPQDELLAWTAEADAGIVPYQATCLNNRYCTPNKLFEFLVAGLPILGSDLPEIRALVEGHGAGRVAELGTEEQVAAAIDDFFSDSTRLARWRESARQARQVVNWQAEAPKVLRVFGDLR